MALDMHGKGEFLLNFIVSNIFVGGCLRKSFCNDFRESGEKRSPFCEKNQVLEFKKNDVYEKWKFWPGIETKDLQGVKSFSK